MSNDKWVNIGTFRHKDPVKETKPYIVLQKGVEIYKDGKKVDLGQYNVLKLTDALSYEKFQLDKGDITQEQFEEAKSKLNDKGIRSNIARAPLED